MSKKLFLLTNIKLCTQNTLGGTGSKTSIEQIVVHAIILSFVLVLPAFILAATMSRVFP